MKAKLVRASRAHHLSASLLFLSLLALPHAALADGCTPITSSGSPVTNSTVTCTGVTLNQNNPLSFPTGYGTFNETGDTIDVQTMASATGDTFGFALGDGNTVNNSGSVTGGTTGINTTSGTTITVNNLTTSSTISGTTGEGLNVTDVVLSNAGTISGGSDGIIAVGSVVLTSNTGSIMGTTADAEGIFANSVSGSNAGTISGVVGIDTSFGTDVNLSSNSGTIQANGGFAINSKGDVFIGTNSGTIASDGLAGTHFARAINAGGSVTVTNTSTGNITATNALNGFGDAIVAVGDTIVVNSGNISGDGRAIDAQSLSSTGLSLINNFGGSITGGSGDAVDGVGSATITNAGTITSQLGNGVFIGADANITNTSTGVIETTGTDAEAVIAGSLLLNNAGIVRVTNSTFFAVDVTGIETGSINSGTISGNLAAINADDSIDMTNSGTITGGILAIQANNTITFDNMGTVTGDRRGLVANDVEITNSGTISATGASGLQAIAIVTLTGNITNTASGTISAAGAAANNDAINAADTTTIDNAGMISSSGRSGVRAGGNATIINESGGTITGVTGIVIRDAGLGFGAPVNSSVFNAGTITGTGGTAINFAFTAGAGPMTLTLAPGSVINGLVLGTGVDTFQLGGKGSGTFDVDNIGSTQQYQGFTTFNKVGSSTWTLTGTGSQGWNIVSGTLIGDTNSLGAATFPVSAGATLEFKQDIDSTYAGVVSGAGSLAKDGSGTLILTGTNTITGGLTISSGTLQIGNGGTTGSIVGDVVDNATLAFDRSDNSTFAGAISGSGALTQIGGGTLTLTADSTYTGGTTISGAILQVGNGGTTGSITGNVVDNATLVFDRSDTSTFAGTISGAGAVAQIGSGTLILTGTNTFTGGTTISGGTLQIGNGGTSGSITGSVVDNATLAFDRSDNVSFAGTVSGLGSLAQIGTGTLTLTADNTYTGGTTIGAGTLQIGNGGTTGSIVGNVADNGTLVFDRSNNSTFAGAISGSGGVVQSGSGATILTGTSNYTGPTIVNAGILDVNGSIATSAVTVNGGTLKGNGTVGSLTLVSGATVAPGNSIGTLHVAGNVTFAAGSIYSVELNPAGQSDLIAATGAATIASGALVQISAVPGAYGATTHYVILTASGGVTGTFAAPTISLPFLSAQLIYAPTEVDLLLTIKEIDFAPLALTPNEIATAAAVKAGGPQSIIDGQFLQDSLNGLAFVTNALDQLSGEIHPSLVTAELEDSRLVQLSILGRLRQASTGDASGLLAPAPAEAREIAAGLSMWTHAFADWGTVEGDGNVATLDQNLSGVLAGIDGRIDAVNVGVAGGFSHSHANQRNSVAKGDNSYVAAYGGWADGAVALRVGGTYGWGNRGTLRTVVFPGFAETLTAKQDQHESQLFGEVAYAFNTERLSLEPFAGITWDDASTGAFAEQGGAAAVSGTGGDTSVAYSSLGVRLAARPVGVDALAVTPRASIAWQHAFGGLHPGQVLTFEDTGQSFLALGSVIDSDSADIALGVDAQIGSGGTLSLGYEGILSSRVRLNTLHAGLNWDF